jgi:hypothetical protein
MMNFIKAVTAHWFWWIGLVLTFGTRRVTEYRHENASKVGQTPREHPHEHLFLQPRSGSNSWPRPCGQQGACYGVFEPCIDSP